MTTMKYIDRATITALITEAGQSVTIYNPTNTTDMGGTEVSKAWGSGTSETAYVRLLTEQDKLVQQGLYQTGDADGYFNYDSIINKDSKVTVGSTNYRVLNYDGPNFESEVKFKHAMLRRETYG